MTLVELLTVVAIISVLMAIMVPALQSARESGRRMTCQNNLRQFGVGLTAHAERDPRTRFCSGGFDWFEDGAVTKYGWVADMVNAEIPVGKMLCPSNPTQVSATIAQLLDATPAELTARQGCVDVKGPSPEVGPDGTTVITPAPCYDIVTQSVASGSARVPYANTILAKFYNTNFTASWWLVRSGVFLGPDGRLKERVTGCGRSIGSRNSTYGPLQRSLADTSAVASSFVPLLGDGAVSPVALSQDVGNFSAGTFTVYGATAGPVKKVDMTFTPDTFPAATSYPGWWTEWTTLTWQDYRRFSPLHKGGCNLLFADGGVRTYFDENRDGCLNNGFAAGEGPFQSSDVELSSEEVLSRWALRKDSTGGSN